MSEIKNDMSYNYKDCHFCENASCLDENSAVDCYADFGYFDHHVEDSREAENCSLFEYCDIFPKT